MEILFSYFSVPSSYFQTTFRTNIAIYFQPLLAIFCGFLVVVATVFIVVASVVVFYFSFIAFCPTRKERSTCINLKYVEIISYPVLEFPVPTWFKEYD